MRIKWDDCKASSTTNGIQSGSINTSFSLSFLGLLSLSRAHVLIVYSSQIPGPPAHRMFQAFRGNKLEGTPRVVRSLTSQPLKQTTYCCLKQPSHEKSSCQTKGQGTGLHLHLHPLAAPHRGQPGSPKRHQEEFPVFQMTDQPLLCDPD